MDIVGWVVIVLACIAGYVFTVAPIIPGAILVPAGAAVGMLIAPGIDAWSWWWWIIQGVLVGACMIVDNIAQLVGIQRIGASPRAMWGGVIGVVAGPLALAPITGPVALILGPLAGAVAGTLLGEMSARRSLSAEGATGSGLPTLRRLGITAAVAWIAGTSIKLALLTAQVAIVMFVLA